MERSSINHFINGQYVYKTFRNTYLFRLSCKKGDLKKVNFKYIDKYRFGFMGYNKKDTVAMVKVASTSVLDYYEVEIKCEYPAIKYYFELIDNDGVYCYYSNRIFYDKEPKDIIFMFTANTYILDSCYFDVPEWTKGATFYQIFPERFSPTDKESDNWREKNLKHNYRTNGTLFGIANKIDYLADLGIDCLYLNPIFTANTSHRYDTVDYMKVCPLLGGDEGLHSVVKACHDRGIKVILDIAFNHTSPDFFAFKDLLENQENSKYKDWYFIYKFPFKKDWLQYKCFSYFPGMPKLNTLNPDTMEYLLKVTRYYLEEFDVDGYRLDVCDEVAHPFWKRFRETVKSVKKDAVILGEIWYESTPWLLGDEIDTITNYNSLFAIKNVVNRSISVDEFINTYHYERGNSNINYLASTLNMVSNHDTIRCFRDLGKDEEKMKLAMALDVLLPGATLIYYGDEQMMDGDRDPDCRRGMLFDNNPEMYYFTKRLIGIKKNDAFKNIDFEFVKHSEDVFSLFRYGKDDYEILFNLGDNNYRFREDRFDILSSSVVIEASRKSVYVFKK